MTATWTIKYITGVSCPSCGMTRAYHCLFRFDFAGAFHYHPLFFYALVLAERFLL
ncbi:MAG: DUF2752 domain-containing protein [Clostridiales bacterium]|nr:DUF2752 domain-containing protein [Clostridiales bacterium]